MLFRHQIHETRISDDYHHFFRPGNFSHPKKEVLLHWCLILYNYTIHLYESIFQAGALKQYGFYQVHLMLLPEFADDSGNIHLPIYYTMASRIRYPLQHEFLHSLLLPE